jgi:hypothetical protein
MSSYVPLEISCYFSDRLKDFYRIPPGIDVQFIDANLGLPGEEPCWKILISNREHETPWEAPWGSVGSPDFRRAALKILLEIEERFGVKFPREKK